MKSKKTPAPKRAGTDPRTNEFARLALELAVLNPHRLHALMAELMAEDETGR